MDKSLSTMAIAELEIETTWARLSWAYTPTLLKCGNAAGGNQFGLGVAVANAPGYSPIPTARANFETYDAAADDADRLNRDRGLSDDEAARVVASSMGAGKVADKSVGKVDLKDNQRRALELLGRYTRQSFDAWDLMGPAMSHHRRQIMSCLRGGDKMPPLSQCGVTKLKTALHKLYPPQGGCSAERDSDFATWCKDQLQVSA